MDDHKYVVFKREEYEQGLRDEIPAPPLTDAVVIRTKDRFAGTALRTYADTVSNSVELFIEAGIAVPEGLVEIRDYFYAKSDDAYSSPVKRIPD